MDIVIIGSGNVAHCFSHFLQLNGHHISQVLSRDATHARQLAEKLNTSYSSDFAEINFNADIYLLAVSDSAILQLNEKLRLGKRIVAHTAGSVSLHEISRISVNTGVIYPLQTIQKEGNSGKRIPLLVEGNNEQVLRRLQAIAGAISDEVLEMDSANRLKMHLAAVCCNNFPNYLATLCKDYCSGESLNYTLLEPLLNETMNQMIKQIPDDINKTVGVQTGPAVRGDEETMKKHLALLENYSELQEMYKTFSDSIQKYYQSH